MRAISLQAAVCALMAFWAISSTRWMYAVCSSGVCADEEHFCHSQWFQLMEARSA